MEFPGDILYGPGHLWVREQNNGLVQVGITDFAQDQLGKVIYIDLPEVGDEVSQGEDMGAIESAKSVSDLIAPVSGEVVEVNEALLDEAGPINDDPYGTGWMAVIKVDGALEGLLSAEEYQARVG